MFQVAIVICNQSENISAERVASQLRLAYGNQGCAAGESYDYQGCLHHAGLALDLSKRRLGLSRNSIMDFELGTAYNEVGVAYALQNMFAPAEHYLRQSIKVYLSVEHLKDAMLIWPKLYLGVIQWIQGRLSAAEIILTEILDIQENAFGVDDTKSLL